MSCAWGELACDSGSAVELVVRGGTIRIERLKSDLFDGCDVIGLSIRERSVDYTREGSTVVFSPVELGAGDRLTVSCRAERTTNAGH